MNNENATVAELLKSARVERGLSVKFIAADICVQSSYLTAIEEADYDALPGKTFAIGFVKAYAAALGLDPLKIVETFKQEYCPEISSLQTTPVVKAVKPARKVPVWLAPITGIAGATACWMLLGGGITSNLMMTATTADTVAVEEAQLAAIQANLEQPVVAAPVETGTVTQIATQAEALQSDIEVLEAAAPASKVAEAVMSRSSSFFATAAHADSNETHSVSGNYVLEATEDSWVRIAHSDGTEMWSGILREGQTYRPQADGVVLLSTSNAGGVLLKMSGGEPAFLGERGTVVSDLKLEDNRLLSEQEPEELSEFGSE